jgi:hypothetical protein
VTKGLLLLVRYQYPKNWQLQSKDNRFESLFEQMRFDKITIGSFVKQPNQMIGASELWIAVDCFGGGPNYPNNGGFPWAYHAGWNREKFWAENTKPGCWAQILAMPTSQWWGFGAGSFRGRRCLALHFICSNAAILPIGNIYAICFFFLLQQPI